MSEIYASSGIRSGNRSLLKSKLESEVSSFNSKALGSDLLQYTGSIENKKRAKHPNWVLAQKMYEQFPEVASVVNDIASSSSPYKVIVGGKESSEVYELIEKHYDLSTFRFRMMVDYLVCGHPQLVLLQSDTNGFEFFLAPSYETRDYKIRDRYISNFEWASPELGKFTKDHLQRDRQEGKFVYPGIEFYEFKYASKYHLFGCSPLFTMETKFNILSLFETAVELFYKNGSKLGALHVLDKPENVNPEKWKEFVKELEIKLLDMSGMNEGKAFQDLIVTNYKERIVDEMDISKFIDKDVMEEFFKKLLNLYNIPLERFGIKTSGGGQNSDKFTITQTTYYNHAVKPVADKMDAFLNNYLLPKIKEDKRFLEDLQELGVSQQDCDDMKIYHIKLGVETLKAKADRMRLDLDNGYITLDMYLKEIYNMSDEEVEQSEEEVVEEVIEIDDDEEAEKIIDNHFVNLKRKTKTKQILNYDERLKTEVLGSEVLEEKEFSPVDVIIETEQSKKLQGTFTRAIKKSYSSKLERVYDAVVSKDPDEDTKAIVLGIIDPIEDFIKKIDLVEELLFFSDLAETESQLQVEKDGAPLYNKGVADIVRVARKRAVKSLLANRTNENKFLNAKAHDPDQLEAISEIIDRTTQEDVENAEDLKAYLTTLLLVYQDDDSINSTTAKMLGNKIDRLIAEGLSKDEVIRELEDFAASEASHRGKTISNDTIATIFAASAFISMNVYAPQEKIWLETKSKRPRPPHLSMVGEKVPYNEPFSNGDFWTNLLINCKCSVRVVTKEFSSWSDINFIK